MWLRGISLGLLAFIFAACITHTEFAQWHQIEVSYESGGIEDMANPNKSCRDPLNYTPDLYHPEYTVLAEIRINMHFMDLETGLHNFNEDEGRKFALAVLKGCNDHLANNVQMHLPLNNNVLVLPTRYQLKLTGVKGVNGDDGIYFHEDAELYYYIHGRNTNRNNRDVIRKYELHQDSVINIFFMPHHPDSVGRPKYKAVGTGIMLGTNVKVAQIFSKNPPPASCIGLLNHEIGHVIGLIHT